MPFIEDIEQIKEEYERAAGNPAPSRARNLDTGLKRRDLLVGIGIFLAVVITSLLVR